MNFEIDENPKITHYQCEFCNEMYLTYEDYENTPRVCVDCYCDFEDAQEYLEQGRKDSE